MKGKCNFMTTFDALGVPDDLCAALAADGIVTPFPVQAICLPDALAGRDVCGRARTGSGKTLAFGLAMLERTSVRRDLQPRRPLGLVLVPTRELALQVKSVLAPLAALRKARVLAAYGGVDLDRQIDALRKRVTIVVATPGRLIDLVERGAVDLGMIRVVTLDEADRLADMGFTPQVEWILRRLPKRRQTLLFSATLDGDVGGFVARFMRDPVHHGVGEPSLVEDMRHRFFEVHQMDKVKTAAAIAESGRRVLIFVRTKRGADRLVGQLARDGVRAGALHGGRSQAQRERELKSFASGRGAVLVATDVAARGLHIDDVDIVIHYDPPEDHKAYLHRSGRTARAGGGGTAVTLALWNQIEAVKRIQRRLEIDEPIVEAFSNDPVLGTIGDRKRPAAAAV